jgi:hypothetical protein
VDILINKKDGTFADPVVYQWNGTDFGRQIALTDLNGDGELDILAWDTGLVEKPGFMLNNGDGPFALATQGPAIDNAPDQGFSALVPADVNGDGKMDFIGADGGGFSVYLNSGNGTFNGGTRYYESGKSGMGLAVADFDGDGKLDVANAFTSSTPSDANVFVWSNKGGGAFASGTPYPIPVSYRENEQSPYGITAGDFNGRREARSRRGAATVQQRHRHPDQQGERHVQGRRYDQGGDPE